MGPEHSALLLATHRTKSADGTLIAYYATDPPGPNAPVLVLAGGLGGHHRAWLPQISYLHDRFRFLTWDYRGLFGSADPPPARSEPYAMKRHVEDLEAVLRAQQIDRFSLVGWSMGVQVALEAYSRMPARVVSLALINGTAGRPFDWIGGLPAVGAVLRRLVGLAAHGGPILNALVKTPARRHKLARWLPRLGIVDESVDPELLAELVADVADIRLAAYTHILKAAAEHDASGVLAGVHVPVLVLAGDHDPFTPAALVHSMARHIPDSELRMVPGGGHYLCLEFPDLVNLELERFYGRIGLA